MTKSIEKSLEENGSQAELGFVPRLAMTTGFLDSYTRLERSQQNKVINFIDKFSQNPRSAGINYEKLAGALDEKVRSVRIDQQYRAIVIPPEEGNVYLLAWVAAEQEAYQWALRRVFDRDEESGEILIMSTEKIDQSCEEEASQTPKNALLADYDDDTLMFFGIKPQLLPSVRAITEADEYQILTPCISSAAAMALGWLVRGVPLDLVKRDFIEYGAATAGDQMNRLENNE